MIRVLSLNPDQNPATDIPVDDLPSLLEAPHGVVWVDFENTPPETDEPVLRQVFGFHPLAIDDALQETHVPKLDDWEEYLYIVLNAVKVDPDHPGEVEIQELDVFLGMNYIVTHHDQPIAAVDMAWRAVQRDERYWKNGADRLLYRLVDDLVNQFMPVVEHLDVEIDRAEEAIFTTTNQETLSQIFTLKRTVLQLRRVIAPQREVLNKLARDDFKVIDYRTRVYFRDVYDHLVRMHDLTESVRDLVSGTLDTYLSVINNRMNDIMKTLTIITTLFMPMSFVASFFGMNFFAPVAAFGAWTGRVAFLVAMVLTLLTPTVIYLWIRRRGWM